MPAFLDIALALTLTWATAPADDRPTFPLDRGVCIDRQVRTIPPEPGMRITRDDLAIIRRSGFSFVKVLVNPAVVIRGDRLDVSAFAYFEGVLDDAAAVGLPAVVCVHPEDDFKRRAVGDPAAFASYSGFLGDLAGHLAARFTPGQVALQIMTEPYGTSPERSAWNHWDRLQHALWKVARGRMPGHMLILSGDQASSLEGLDSIEPVDDDRVAYSFTFYEPHLFTWQGGDWREGVIPRLKDLSYPSGDATLAELPRILTRMPEPLKADARAQVERYAAERWDCARLASRIDVAADWRRRHGGKVTLWCAEFGCFQTAARPADRVRYLADLRAVFEERGVGWAYWSYAETFTMMTPDSPPFGPPARQTPDRAVLDALMPARPSSR